MAKGTASIQGEAFADMWKGKKSRAKIAAELGISTSSVTNYSRPGVHQVNIEQWESWPESLRAKLLPKMDGEAESDEVVIRVSDLLDPKKRAELVKLYSGKPMNKAAKADPKRSERLS